MPRYVYECPEGHLSEETFSVADAPDEMNCLLCGVPARRIIAPSSFLLKGDGWYRDGYSKPPKTSGGES